MKIEELTDFLTWYWLEDKEFDNPQVVFVSDRRDHLFYQSSGIGGDITIPREEWNRYRLRKIEPPKEEIC